MNLVIVGGNDHKSIESFYRESFSQSIDCTIFPTKNIFKEYYDSNVNKVLYKLGLSSIERAINERLKAYIEKVRPDVVLVFKGMRLLPSTVEWMRNRAFLVMYNPDHPYIYSGRGSGNENMASSRKFYHLYLTYAKDIMSSLIQDGIPSERVPFGYNISSSEFEAMLNLEERNELCFLGNGDTHRAGIINGLAESGLPVVVYGTNWKGLLTSSIAVYPGVYELDFWRTMRQYRVQLNIMRAHNVNSHNMRTFDIPAVGGIQLAPDTLEHREFFDEGEIFFYNNLSSCVNQAQKLLSYSEKRANEVRYRARSRSINSGYSYKDRANQMLRLITSRLN